MNKLIKLFISLFSLFHASIYGQSNIVTYAGNGGKETFYDVLEITDGTFIVSGYADDLNWISANVPRIQLEFNGNIPNSQGSNRFGFLLHLSSDLQSILEVIHFPQGAVEDIRFVKTNSIPYSPTGDLYISCNTSDTDANNGGYIIAKLNHNFISGIPTELSWFQVVWAKSYAKSLHPWDVNSLGEVYYVSGEAHGYDWSAMYCLDFTGRRKVVPNWRTHWLNNGSEWKGSPASTNPFGSIDSVNYSGIVFKHWGRCELRSWTNEDFNGIYPDGNGGTRKGKWPADFLFDSPCDPANPSASSPGYNGYSPESCCPVWGASSITIDRRNDNVYLGMNFKSYYNPADSPDFEPAVIAFDNTGNMLWWNRLYHEITPAGDTVGSIPDQYVDGLAIDYTNDNLVVAARAHGNNTENLWEGNTINIDPNAYGFQNQFTGTNGNIHQSWLGKLRLQDGTLMNSTYVAEMTESTGNLGTPHPNPNLDGWPDPNTGWPNVNTTYITKNNIKISSNGDVCMLGVGRRTITTANAYQKMVKPYFGGQSCWNSFVRVYDSQLHLPKYSSLIVGVWDTLTQAGGSNTDLFGVYKTSQGVICVGRQTADLSGIPIGNNLPIINQTPWGNANPQNESALLVYYKASNLNNSSDGYTVTGSNSEFKYINEDEIRIYPNPSSNKISVSFSNHVNSGQNWTYSIDDLLGKSILQGRLSQEIIDVSAIPQGFYQIRIYNGEQSFTKKVIITK